MAHIHDLNTRNFLRNLAKYENTYFVTPWAGVIVRNCDSSGNLIQHNTTQSYIRSKTPFWIYLNVKIFRDEEGVYGAFVCPTCQSMASLPMMTMDQRRRDIENLLCLHSVVAAHRTDWREIWGLPVIAPEIFSTWFRDKGNDSFGSRPFSCCCTEQWGCQINFHSFKKEQITILFKLFYSKV